MLARSSRRELALVLLALGCSSGFGCGAKAPEGDPAAFAAIAGTMIKNVPMPGATECTGAQVLGGATMTMRTVLQIAKRPYEKDQPERRDFVNPPELDVPAARVLADDKAPEGDRRRAAAELAAAPFYLVYQVDHVDVPMALGVKELKRGFVGARALKYDRQGALQCIRVFQWENDKQVSDRAIAKSNKALIDPAIAKLLQDDLTAQMLKRIAALGAPPPVGTEMAQKPAD
jgi:hypothetical protein